jgi:hypothetical protein
MSTLITHHIGVLLSDLFSSKLTPMQKSIRREGKVEASMGMHWSLLSQEYCSVCYHDIGVGKVLISVQEIFD